MARSLERAAEMHEQAAQRSRAGERGHGRPPRDTDPAAQAEEGEHRARHDGELQGLKEAACVGCRNNLSGFS